MLTGDELAARLRTADQAWSTMQGTSRCWRRRDLVNAAFTRHFDHQARKPDWTIRMVSSTDEQHDAVDDGTVEAVLAVAVEAHGRRRRAQMVSHRGEECVADLVVIDGPRFWARTGDIVHTNDGDESHHHGGTDISNLLLPGLVPDGYHLNPLHDEEQIAGRACVVANAIPREPDPYGRTPGSEVFNMIAGGTLFRLSIDLHTAMLLRVVKLVDNIEAEICEFLDITLDAPLDDELFAPLT